MLGETAGILTALGVIYYSINKAIKDLSKKNTSDTNKLATIINNMDYNQSKTYLTDFLADVNRGIPKSDTQICRAYEVYDHYIKDLEGNSYVRTEWARLMKGVDQYGRNNSRESHECDHEQYNR